MRKTTIPFKDVVYLHLFVYKFTRSEYDNTQYVDYYQYIDDLCRFIVSHIMILVSDSDNLSPFYKKLSISKINIIYEFPNLKLARISYLRII